ncbi:flagellar filament capping protein FliD [Sphingomonas jatrophae]|uniref:Flagellar hook-associated protein 2 n=1 Tax=Sphingomonas jatrophae TaxID=1166337 RepID=A0A1I6M0K3_9SPHN|nr:flagellar filament capping protein FliD [Sphingomonas jatrophae]SFS09249.1 flagellar hook-associated protein 2 [Sphingomonas jatrophae]
MTTIANALGIGSGIDTTALVSSLTAAARDPKNAALTARETANSAKVSALAQATSAIDSFATSLGALISGGTLFTQPTVSDEKVLTATALPGARIDGLSASITVSRLAQGQTNASATLASATAKVGEGRLNLNVGGKTLAIDITSANDSLNGLATAINAQKAGVTASVVTDTTGARLVLRGATGAANAFTLTLPDGTGDGTYTDGLARFAVNADGTGGLSQTQAALDAKINIDGVETTRGTNSVADLIPGVQLTLVKTSDQPVTLGTQRPTASIRSAVQDFVSAYNTLDELLDGMTATAGTDGSAAGALAGEASIRAMRRAMTGLTSTALSSGSGPKTLSEIGVRTQRDGTLTLDTATLDAKLAQDPAGVEALFNPGQTSSTPLVSVVSAYGKTKPGTYKLTDLVPAAGTNGAQGKIAGMAGSGSGDLLTAFITSDAAGLVVRVSGPVDEATVTIDAGLGGALQAIRDSLRGTSGALTTASTRFAAEAKAIAADRTKMESRIATYKAQLETSFTAMESRMSLLNATKTQLTNQIAQWNKSDS